MFQGCQNITVMPELPATTLAPYCYGYMFAGTGISAPTLPNVELVDGCYSDMFRGCTSLTTAPELPATTLAESCYASMFWECTKLNYIKMLATDISAFECLIGWVFDVASTGTFIKNPDGAVEAGSSKLEKRDVSDMGPCYDASNCISCNLSRSNTKCKYFSYIEVKKSYGLLNLLIMFLFLISLSLNGNGLFRIPRFIS
jgi:hypothetical protein